MINPGSILDCQSTGNTANGRYWFFRPASQLGTVKHTTPWRIHLMLIKTMYMVLVGSVIKYLLIITSCLKYLTHKITGTLHLGCLLLFVWHYLSIHPNIE